MPKSISLTSGSVFNGSPITVAITPNTISKGTPSFHRIVVEVSRSMGGTFDPVLFSTSVQGSEPVVMDISSALRALADSYEYSPTPTSYPVVSFRLAAHDEYMLDGEVFKTDKIYYPSSSSSIGTLFGRVPDIERGTAFPGITRLSRKPTTPHLASLGELFVYASSYSSPQSLSGGVSAPSSSVVSVGYEGLNTIAGLSVYALPKSSPAQRQVFRFINSCGVMESISVPSVYSKRMAVTSERFAVARQETLNQFSRAVVRKQNNHELWAFLSDPLTEEWLNWYLHEFMMSEHIWIEINDTFIPCTLTPDENITFLDTTKHEHHTLSFTVELDINGSPIR